MVSVWDHLVLKAKVRVVMVCWIIFDDQQQEKGASSFSVRQNRPCWTVGISLHCCSSFFCRVTPLTRHGKYLSMMENRIHGSHFGLADTILEIGPFWIGDGQLDTRTPFCKMNLSFAFAPVLETSTIISIIIAKNWLPISVEFCVRTDSPPALNPHCQTFVNDIG